MSKTIKEYIRGGPLTLAVSIAIERPNDTRGMRVIRRTAKVVTGICHKLGIIASGDFECALSLWRKIRTIGKRYTPFRWKGALSIERDLLHRAVQMRRFRKEGLAV